MSEPDDDDPLVLIALEHAAGTDREGSYGLGRAAPEASRKRHGGWGVAAELVGGILEVLAFVAEILAGG
jgi:hypothetical protein